MERVVVSESSILSESVSLDSLDRATGLLELWVKLEEVDQLALADPAWPTPQRFILQ